MSNMKKIIIVAAAVALSMSSIAGVAIFGSKDKAPEQPEIPANVPKETIINETLDSIYTLKESDCDYITEQGETILISVKSDYNDSKRIIAVPNEINGNPVTQLGESKGVFYNCDNVEEIILPESIVKIQSNAFSGTDNLKKIRIPKNVNHISYSAFSDCVCLTEIIVDDENPNFISEDGVLYEKTKEILRCYPSAKTGTSFTVPSMVELIGAYAFYGCKNITDIIIPDSVIGISNFAFEQCSNLKRIKIPDSLEFFGVGTFIGCMFETFIIPKSVEGISERAFSDCTNLKSIILSDGLRYIDSIAFGNSGLETIYIPDSVTSIDTSAFSQCYSLREVKLPRNIDKISDYMFCECRNLESIVITECVESIGEYAFNNCEKLKNINLPSGLLNINESAFAGCADLKNISIPNTLTKIDGNVFYGCTSLEEISVSKNNPKFKSVDGVLFSKNADILFVYPHAKTEKSYTIPNSVKVIKKNAFCSNRSLEKIVFGKNVEKICDFALSGCLNLKTIILPKRLKSVYRCAFSGCDNLADIYYAGSEKEWKNIISEPTTDETYDDYFSYMPEKDPFVIATKHYNYSHY